MKRLLKLAFLVLIVLAGIGWWQGFFKFEAFKKDGDTSLTVTFDDDRIREATDNAAAAAKAVSARISDEMRDMVRRGRFDGVVKGLDGATLLVESDDGKPVRVPLAADTEIELDGKRVEATRLKPGDRVTVDLPEGAAYARRIEATREKRDR